MISDKNTRVSILCITYNHENYIRDALDGFVNQITDFPFEVIVHDDASTDGTALIIKEYEKKYPDIIKAIYEKENQYSKQNISILRDIIYPMTKSEYIALCEGDDYWNDNHKLQKQVDFLDNNPDYSATVHNTYRYDVKSGDKTIMFQNDTDYDLDFSDIIVEGGNCYHTSSLLLRKEYFLYPNEFVVRGVGDYPLSIYLALKGKIRYFKECMSVYRVSVPGSWSETNSRSLDKQYSLIDNVTKMLNEVDEYTNYNYHKDVATVVENKRKSLVQILLIQKRYRKIIKEYKDVLKKWTLTERIKLYVKSLICSSY